MLSNTDLLLAVVRNIEQQDFKLFPKFELTEEEAKAVAFEIEKIVAQRMLNHYIDRQKSPDLDCAMRN